MTQTVDQCIQALIKTCAALSADYPAMMHKSPHVCVRNQEYINHLSQPRKPPERPPSPVFSFTPSITARSARKSSSFDGLYASAMRQMQRRAIMCQKELDPPSALLRSSSVRAFDFSKRLYYSKTLYNTPPEGQHIPRILSRSRALAEEKRRREFLQLLEGSALVCAPEQHEYEHKHEHEREQHEREQKPLALTPYKPPALTQQYLRLFFARQQAAALRKQLHIQQQEQLLGHSHQPAISEISRLLTRSRSARFAEKRSTPAFCDPNETYAPKINEISRILAVRKSPYYDYKAQLEAKRQKIERLRKQFTRQEEEAHKVAEATPKCRTRRSVLSDPNSIGDYYREKLRRRDGIARAAVQKKQEEELSQCTFRPNIRYVYTRQSKPK